MSELKASSTDPSDAQLRALLDLAARRALYYSEYQYKAWGYGEWIALEGLLAAADHCDSPRYAGYVEGLITGWMSKRDALVAADHVAPGVSMIRLYESTGQSRYLDRARAVADLILKAPRSSRGGRLLGTDLNTYVIIDCMYSDPCLFAHLGRLEGDDRWHERAITHILDYWDALESDELALLYHAFDNQTSKHAGRLWGRGIGFALLGMVDTAVLLPRGIPSRDRVVERLEQMADKVRQLQAGDGNWHTVINEPQTYLEPSIAALMFTALSKAVRSGLLDPECDDSAKRAWNAFRLNIKPSGEFPVSEATAMGSITHYNSLRLGIYPWGQGAAMRAIEERLIRDDESLHTS